MTSRRRLILTAAAAAALFSSTFVALPVQAHGRLVDVQLVDRDRAQALPIHPARGSAWVAGRPGARYAVRLTNRTGQRLLVVLSVDGVNAVSGETATTNQVGYVLAPWQSSEITGWRKSLTEAAAFYFTALPDSYAARTDRPDNVGVIGVAVFREREQPAVAAPPLAAPDAERGAVGSTMNQQRAESESARARDGMGAPSAKAAPAQRDERLGTGHGEREYAPTTRTAFERARETPDEIVQLRYDSVENLRAAGIIVVPRPWRAPAQPEPFPGFVADPRG